MPLFVAQHHHLPRRCPACASGQELLAQISAAHATRHGVTIEAEAIINGEHRLILILDAPDGEAVERFLAFLRSCGDLQIMASSTAEEAVLRGGCGAVHEPVEPKGAESSGGRSFTGESDPGAPSAARSAEGEKES